MWLEVNGKTMQDGSTSTMVYGVNFLVSYLSQFMSLQPGDIISTGTPFGVGLGLNPPKYLKEGDEVELGVEGLGISKQICVAYKNETATHLGGSGLGGGTIRGLCKLSAQVDDPEEINELSMKGSQIGDYTLKDVISGPIGNLPEDSIAVHLGNLDMMNKLEKEDVCRSIIYLVATNIARLAATTALATSLKKIVVVGRSPNFILYKEILTKWIEYAGLEVTFPEKGEFATAIGALES